MVAVNFISVFIGEDNPVRVSVKRYTYIGTASQDFFKKYLGPQASAVNVYVFSVRLRADCDYLCSQFLKIMGATL